MMPTLRTGSRGFTLIELLVTLFIIALLSSITMVSLWGMLEHERLYAGSRMVLGVLRYARDYAVAHRTDTEVRLGGDTDVVAVYVKETDDSGAENWRVLTTSAGQQRPLPEGVHIVSVVNPDDVDSAHDPGVNFTALGQGERLHITLQDADGKTCAIEVDGLTGQCGLVKDTAPVAK